MLMNRRKQIEKDETQKEKVKMKYKSYDKKEEDEWEIIRITHTV